MQMKRITKQPRMCRTSNALYTFVWQIYINDCTYALNSVYRRLFAINVQSMVNMSRSERRVPCKEVTEFESGHRTGIGEYGL